MPALQEVDIEVIRTLCQPYPAEHGFVLRLRQNPGALYLAHWQNHFEWQFAASVLPAQGRILDWGCGTGHSDFFLAAKGFEVIGVDIDPLGIQIANYVRSLQDQSIQNAVSFQLEAPKLDYDAAWSSHVLEHVPTDEWMEFFAKIRQTGAPSVLISVPLKRAYFDPDHKNFWENAEHLSEDLQTYSDVEIDWVVVNAEHEVIRAMLRLS